MRERKRARIVPLPPSSPRKRPRVSVLPFSPLLVHRMTVYNPRLFFSLSPVEGCIRRESGPLLLPFSALADYDQTRRPLFSFPFHLLRFRSYDPVSFSPFSPYFFLRVCASAMSGGGVCLFFFFLPGGRSSPAPLAFSSFFPILSGAGERFNHFGKRWSSPSHGNTNKPAHWRSLPPLLFPPHLKAPRSTGIVSSRLAPPLFSMN